MLFLFTVALFLSSTLLFLIEPMMARMVLPVLGGTPAVWNTCMVFFQAALLAGYLYAHAGPRWLGARNHAILHVVLLFAALAGLPVAIGAFGAPPVETTPIFWLLRLLAATVGLPVMLLGATSPLLQRWLAHSNHRDAADPYYLYAAGNVGSILALLGYPLLVERTLSLNTQTRYWAVGYAALGALMLLSFFAQSRWSMREAPEMPLRAVGADTARVDARQRFWWVLLAFVPSSLMLGVTTFLTTNIAAAPLLWVLPLAIYLLTFVLVFAAKPPISHAAMVRFLPLAVLPLAGLMVFDSRLPAAVLVTAHLVVFFMAAMVCHGELARSRPSTTHLTDFYLWLSVGGVLGGLFNALLAPIAFTTIVEYPLAVVLACALRRPGGARDVAGIAWSDFVLPVALGLTVFGVMLGAGANSERPIALLFTFVVPAVICYSFRGRPVRFALGVAALIIAGTAFMSAQERVMFRDRGFFGVHRITLDQTRRWRELIHGGIVHGMQSPDPALRREPTAYFHRSGPIGQVFTALGPSAMTSRVAVIGLGIGTLAAYGAPGEDWTFYEIDPAVERIARDSRYFTYLADSPASVHVVLGDARLKLADAPDRKYTLIVLDAFASDAIPVHLITREALQLYVSKLGAHGVIAFHVSNRYVDLPPVLGALARDAHLVALAQDDVIAVGADGARYERSWTAGTRRALAADSGDAAANCLDRRLLEPAQHSSVDTLTSHAACNLAIRRDDPLRTTRSFDVHAKPDRTACQARRQPRARWPRPVAVAS
jgi:hypothetical protein